ncbi:MAG: permease [Oscillospiraceae bacterium]|nr:permease [Oscillospiraceae bacterium]
MTLQWFIDSIPILLMTCWDYLIQILPYLLIGILIGELLKFTSWTKIVYKWVSKSPFISVVSASIIGMVSPLCTYGTIPVVIELYKSGVSVAPLITFLSASSLMNPQLFIMTLGGIGVEMAVARIIAVFIFSVIIGMLTYFLPKKYIVKKNIEIYENGGTNISSRGKKIFIVKQYLLNCFEQLKNVGFYLLIGILLGAIIQLYIPSKWVLDSFQAGRIQSILFAALLGIPMYACGGGAIPLVRSMMDQGMGNGAALAFFIVGPATRPTPLSAMAALFTPLFLVGYCVFLLISSIIMGLVYV